MTKLNVNMELLERYVRIIHAMNMVRDIHNIKTYSVLEEARRDLHNQLLDAAGVARNNAEFNMELASLIDEMVS